ncbi:tetratricopeptide repeat-containing sulfotransferase family protein [Sphingomonas radiodurans]|uniref:tetratricopeptide repeat-containing sulfotransferase family protein n=1 Tax=Sphingomonas radiodurans TaxID=2890321 RepID=UPI001E537A38|nr:sulfotransferase [Sphingomonas radiodurans]WBH15031.1 sulfotransferase [Sphingomonas radiodurans]
MIACDPAAAVTEARAAIRDLPDLVQAYRLLASALRAVGDVSDAEQQEMRAVDVALRNPAVVRARREFASGRTETAAQEIGFHLRTDPENPGALHLLGQIAEHSHALREAEGLFRRAVALAPIYYDARLSLASLLNKTRQTDEALSAIDAVLAREPAHLKALSLKATMLVQHRRAEAAGAAFSTLLIHHPHAWRGWMNHGHFLKASGRIDQAVAAYRRAITIAPEHGILWWALANLKPVPLDAADIVKIDAALATSKDPADRVHLHFALGNGLDALGDHATAIEQLRAGNALRHSLAPHDADRFSALIRKSEDLFTAKFLEERARFGAPAADPIFIVGMPRSGSTLIEQILASHPSVEGTEELRDLNEAVKSIMVGRRADSYLDLLPSLSAGSWRAVGERYLNSTARYRRTDRPFFTDKMPSNWIYTGLILLALPNARIIDVRRHPMACGFANFAQHYNWGNSFAYDLCGIGSFYSDYVRLMTHFDRMAPGRVHRVHHEAIVKDLEGEVRRLLDYLALPFDAACLRFFETERAVHTPSTTQVRRPIDGSGLRRWEAYKDWLGPLEQALEPLLQYYPATPHDG